MSAFLAAARGGDLAAVVRPALVNGAAGLVSYDAAGRPFSVLAFTVRDSRIVEIDVLADPARVGRVAVPTARE